MASRAKRRSKKASNPPSEYPVTLLNTFHSVSPPSCLSLSPDGKRLAASNENGDLLLCDLIRKSVSEFFVTNLHRVRSVTWCPDGRKIAYQTGRGAIIITDAATGFNETFVDGFGVPDHLMVWSPNGKMLAVKYEGTTIIVLDGESGGALLEHEEEDGDTIKCFAWAPDQGIFCYGSNLSVKMLDISQGRVVGELVSDESVISLSWSPDGQWILSGSDNCTVSIWNAHNGKLTHVLEGHTSEIIDISFLDDGRLLAAVAADGTVILWRTDTWSEAARADLATPNIKSINQIEFHPTLPLVAALGSSMSDINIWRMNFELILQANSKEQTFHYVTAKVVLLGDTGVGKSGLGIRIAEQAFRPTESTHGAHFWRFNASDVQQLPSNIQAELVLWDFAGQPEYRLTHQLFLDDADAALILFDCSDHYEPFRGVPYWAKALRKHTPPHTVKFLVSARCDVSPPTVTRDDINQVLDEYGLHEYFRTSAKRGEGVEELFSQLVGSIPWQHLVRTSTPEVFQAIREFLLERKQYGQALVSMEEVRRGLSQKHLKHEVTLLEINTVVALLQGRGLVRLLNPRTDLVLVLTRPELINQYAASIIQAARNHPLGIGAVAVWDVIRGSIAFSGFDRLLPHDELLMLQATTELLLQHDLCFRQMGSLVFPSQINLSRPVRRKTSPRIDVSFQFSGNIETIYASLVVRLSRTAHFRREGRWNYSAEFSRGKKRLGFFVHQIEEGVGRLDIYFDTGVKKSDRITFIRFITDHLQTKGIDIEERVHLRCSACGKEIVDEEAIEARISAGLREIHCQYCSALIPIPMSLEQSIDTDDPIVEEQEALATIIERIKENELQQLRADQKNYADDDTNLIQILHLSDIHITGATQVGLLRTQLETDLIGELGIRRLDYLVISGDIANAATEKEYSLAYGMLNELVNRFGLDQERLVIVPGNHDIDWSKSRTSYRFTYSCDLRHEPPDTLCIPAGDQGRLVRDEELYKERFNSFNQHFYRSVRNGIEYPLDYARQAVLLMRPKDRILFLGLNSSWEIDHHFQNRASINMEALAAAINTLRDKDHRGWLKIAVWHHPIAGTQMMNEDFMQLLATNNFQICLHGHIHESTEGFYKYDERRAIHLIGAGPFDAPTGEMLPGIPLQYNLLTFDPTKGTLVVTTRKKEKANGAWAADARWGSKNAPNPYYEITIKGLQGNPT